MPLGCSSAVQGRRKEFRGRADDMPISVVSCFLFLVVSRIGNLRFAVSCACDPIRCPWLPRLSSMSLTVVHAVDVLQLDESFAIHLEKMGFSEMEIENSSKGGVLSLPELSDDGMGKKVQLEAAPFTLWANGAKVQVPPSWAIARTRCQHMACSENFFFLLMNFSSLMAWVDLLPRLLSFYRRSG